MDCLVITTTITIRKVETLVQHSAAGTSGGGDDGMLANTSGGMTAQGMETINPDDLAEDEVKTHVIAIPYPTSVALRIWKVVVHI